MKILKQILNITTNKIAIKLSENLNIKIFKVQILETWLSQKMEFLLIIACSRTLILLTIIMKMKNKIFIAKIHRNLVMLTIKMFKMEEILILRNKKFSQKEKQIK